MILMDSDLLIFLNTCCRIMLCRTCQYAISLMPLLTFHFTNVYGSNTPPTFNLGRSPGCGAGLRVKYFDLSSHQSIKPVSLFFQQVYLSVYINNSLVMKNLVKINKICWPADAVTVSWTQKHYNKSLPLNGLWMSLICNQDRTIWKSVRNNKFRS